jgi:hypothetical protein
MGIIVQILSKWENAMPFIPAIDVFRCAVLYRNDDGIEGLNILNVTHGVGDFHTQAGSIYDTIYAWYLASKRVLLTAPWRLESVEVRDVSVAGGAVEIIPTPTGFHGLSAGAPDANGIAMTVTLQTGFAGKSQRGRIYDFGLPVASRTETQWNEADVAAVQASYQSLLDALTANDSRLQVVSYQHAGAPRVSAQVTEVIAVRANIPVYRQWRRMTAP